MSFLWEAVKGTAKVLGSAAGEASYKTKLKAEIVLLDREITARQSSFGVELYDHVSPLTASADFFAANDTLTENLRPALLKAQREIAALGNKVNVSQQQQQQAAASRAAAFPDSKAEKTWQDLIVNGAKSTAMATNEAKLKTEHHFLQVEINHHKEIFGQEIYKVFVNLEDTQGWIPTNREIRSIYDSCRKDCEEIGKRKKEKEQALEAPATEYQEPTFNQQMVGTVTGVAGGAASGLNTTPYASNAPKKPVTAPQRQLQQPGPGGIADTLYGSSSNNQQQQQQIPQQQPAAAYNMGTAQTQHAGGYGMGGASQQSQPLAAATYGSTDPFAPQQSSVQQQQPVNGMFSFPGDGQNHPATNNPLFSYPDSTTADPFAPAATHGANPTTSAAPAPVDPFANNDFTAQPAPAAAAPNANLASTFSTNHEDPFAGL